jgi:hypothetical protein
MDEKKKTSPKDSEAQRNEPLPSGFTIESNMTSFIHPNICQEVSEKKD